MDAKEIIENYIPIGATNIIAGRFVKKCILTEIFIAGKCIMFRQLVSIGGNLLVVFETMSANKSIIKYIS